MAEAVCRHKGCEKRLSDRNTSGLCRSHCSQAMFRDPAFVKRIREGSRAKHRELEFRAQNSQSLKDLHADPEFAAAHSRRLSERHKSGWRPTPRQPVSGPKVDDRRFLKMTDQEREDYMLLRSNAFTVVEALQSIGRPDLVKS